MMALPSKSYFYRLLFCAFLWLCCSLENSWHRFGASRLPLYRRSKTADWRKQQSEFPRFVNWQLCATLNIACVAHPQLLRLQRSHERPAAVTFPLAQPHSLSSSLRLYRRGIPWEGLALDLALSFPPRRFRLSLSSLK